MVIVIDSVIGGLSWVQLIWLADINVTVQLQVSDYSQLSNFTVQLQPYTIISENRAVNAPWIKFDKIVMVTIKGKTINLALELTHWPL